MRILAFTNCPLDPKLGSGKTVLMYSTQMRELGHNVEVLEPKDYDILKKVNRARKFIRAWSVWRMVNNRIDLNEYDLVEFYGDDFWPVIWQLSKLSRRPLLVAHTNGLELLARERELCFNASTSIGAQIHDWLSKQTHSRFSKIAFEKVDAFVSLCQLDCQYMIRNGYYKPEQTQVVGPGLDREYLSIPFSEERQNRIAFTGTWIARKGSDKIVTVMSEILKQNPTLIFDIYGAGVGRETVLSQFPKDLQNQIMYHPKITNQELSEGLSKAKIFFFPTQYEGFGMALAEAMACGCAVVTTPTGFGADLVNEEEALICDFDDTLAMTKAVTRLLNDDNFRSKLSFKGWKRVQNLTWEISGKQLEMSYKDWLSEFKHKKG